MYNNGIRTIALSALALAANAETIRIDAGKDGLAFTPDSVTAKVGDILEFHFHPINHSVVMGDFNNACQPAQANGFFSGFMPVSSGEGKETFQVTVNSTDPIFFYCAQNVASHCKGGMSGVVNPTSGQTLDAYKKAATSAKSASNPANIFGGKVVTVSDTSSTSSAKPSPTSGGNNGGGGGGAYGGGASGGSKGNDAGGIRNSIDVVSIFALGMAALLAL